ncbi:unnamed protein product [Lactuca virosa]|uniref:Uncharacterized protein n=1 Tax=Lactuca virosa TaxID=75947 RepID=A0AAU9PBM5_9ASTR|nr:unnamed protein product [Lactuca virosa]
MEKTSLGYGVIGNGVTNAIGGGGHVTSCVAVAQKGDTGGGQEDYIKTSLSAAGMYVKNTGNDNGSNHGEANDNSNRGCFFFCLSIDNRINNTIIGGNPPANITRGNAHTSQIKTDSMNDNNMSMDTRYNISNENKMGVGIHANNCGR